MLRSAFALCVASLVAAPAAASSYLAKPAVLTPQRVIARDIVWNCGPAACQGSTEESRPVVICQSLAKREGRIDSFMVDGREFGAAELRQCNAVALKTPAVRAVAAQ